MSSRDFPIQTHQSESMTLGSIPSEYNCSFFRRLSSNMPILFQLIFYDGLGDWREINDAIDIDVQRTLFAQSMMPPPAG